MQILLFFISDKVFSLKMIKQKVKSDKQFHNSSYSDFSVLKNRIFFLIFYQFLHIQ